MKLHQFEKEPIFNKTHEWLQKKELNLNVEKTNLIVFGIHRNNESKPISITLKNKFINIVNSTF